MDDLRNHLEGMSMRRSDLDPRHALFLGFLTAGAACCPAYTAANAGGLIHQAALSEQTETGGSTPFTSCADDGICNAAVCSPSKDPDCIGQNCNQDGRCNTACTGDPDCPAPKVCSRGGPFVDVDVTTSCGRSASVRRAVDDPLVQARARVERKWPNFRAAKDLDYDDDDDGNNEGKETCWREGHAEANLANSGVSLTRADPGPLGGCTDSVWVDVYAGNDPDRPSLLFFEKTSSDKRTWRVIGAGYHYDYQPCSVPCLLGVSESEFLIHEGGWHRVPGDGGFDCVEQRWIDNNAGIRVTDRCAVIEKKDFHRTSIAFGANKHERLWTLHVFFEPGGSGVAVAETDPWCRDRDDASDEPVVTTSCDAFYPRAQDCNCR